MSNTQAHSAGGVIAITGAIPLEVAPILRMDGFRPERAGELSYRAGTIGGADVAVLVSGMGDEAAYTTAKAACANLPLKAYVCVGLSGSLSATLRPGDVIVGMNTLSPAGKSYPYDAALINIANEIFSKHNDFIACPCAPSLRPMQTSHGYPAPTRGGASEGLDFGPLAATAHVVATAAEKRRLAQSGALAVDMESAGAARAAAEAGVPFIAIRGISDGYDEDLPVDFGRFMKGAGLDWPRFILHVLAHPWVIPGLLRLGRQSKAAAGRVAEAVGELILSF